MNVCKSVICFFNEIQCKCVWAGLTFGEQESSISNILVFCCVLAKIITIFNVFLITENK